MGINQRQSILFLSKHMVGVLIAIFALAACSGGGGSRKTSSKKQTTEEPPADDNQGNTNEEDVGIEVGTVDETNGVTVETTGEPKLVHLVTKSSTAIADSKYKSEFLVMVRAAEESCINVKIRPGVAISDEINEDALKAQVEEVGAPCQEEAATLTLTNDEELKADYAEVEQAAAKYHKEAAASSSFNLVANNENDTLCSQRNFRMETLPPGVEPGAISLGGNSVDRQVDTTYGTLVAKSANSKIKVWLDTDYAEAPQICSGGTVGPRLPDTPTPYRLGQTDPTLFGFGDTLFQLQLQKLADVTENILNDMVTRFGPTSDLDSNGAVNIFISPYVNRLNFLKIYTPNLDKFQVLPIYKPGDLFPLNIQENPASNEGEVVYLWAPSPGGVYNYHIYPTSNSLNSNYAYGSFAFQLMGLIINKAKMIGKGLVEEEFLRESLGYLASAYYSGGSYSWREISHYLNGYTPSITLTERFDPASFPGAAAFEGINGQLGMRALFGWYLHSKLCGATTTTPCTEIKDIVANGATGKDAVEGVLGMNWNDILDHFGTSLPIGLLDNPTAIYPIANEAAKDLPDLVEFGHFKTLNPTGTTNTAVEHDSVVAGMSTNSVNEPSYFSPYPTLKHFPFRVITPNNDIELHMKKNSMAYILLTGVVSEYTDITSYLGKGLKVTVVPVGDRDFTKRAFYAESKSKQVALDSRPIKLFDDSVPAVTPRLANFVWETVDPVVGEEDFTVTVDKEAWISGEISNTLINVDGAETEIGDSDMFLLRVDPCKTGSQTGGTSTITGCDDSQEFEVMVQAYVNPGKGALEPVLAITPQDRRAYHGAMVWPEVNTVDPSFEPPETVNPEKYYMCEAGGDSDTNDRYDATDPGSGAIDPQCQMNQLPLANSQCNGVSITSDSPRVECALGEESGGTFVLDSMQDQGSNGTAMFGYDFNFDNFLYMGNGYPYDTIDTMVFWGEDDVQVGIRSFTEEEKNRMFYNFSFDHDLKATNWNFYASRHGFNDRAARTTVGGVSIGNNWNLLTEDQIQSLITIRNKVGSMSTADTALPDEDPFLGVCAEFNINTDLCKEPCTNAGLIGDGISRFLTENKSYVVCDETDSAACPAKALFENYTAAACEVIDPGAGENLSYGNYFTNAFGTVDHDGDGGETTPTPELDLGQEKFIWTAPTDVQYSTYYKPTMPKYADGTQCSGALGTSPFTKCNTFTHEPMPDNDIRQQFWMHRARIRENGQCTGLVYPNDFGLCLDFFSWQKSAPTPAIDPPKYACFDDEGGLTDEARDMKGIINYRSGEMFGLAERVYPIQFNVKGDRSTVVPILIGGLNKSKGKYTIRVRTYHKTSCSEKPGP